MIELQITMTGKGYGKKDEWRSFNQQKKRFATLEEAHIWIKETYGKAKRVPMYVDTKTGVARKVGYVIGFRNADLSHYPVEKWIQQDWIEFMEVKNLTL
jgi:hypothetical protein